MKKALLIIFLVCGCVLAPMHAQDRPSGPDLQMAQSHFFDPGHKEVKEPYQFRMEYRLEAGYVQNNHRTENQSYENLFLHGFRFGATFDFMLPYRFSLQTGVLYTFTTGTATQKWGIMSWEDYTSPDPITGQVYSSSIYHRLYEHQLTIPLRLYYNIHLWKQLNLFFFTGPQLHVGLALQDDMQPNISTATKNWLLEQGCHVEPYDRYQEKELYRSCIQWGLGGGLEWDAYRLQAGYDFGLNNQVRHKVFDEQQMWEWHWFVSFCYRLNSTKKQ